MDFLPAEVFPALALVATLLIWALSPLRAVKRGRTAFQQHSAERERLAVVIPLSVPAHDTPRHAA